MDFSVFRSLKPSSWRSTPSDTISTRNTETETQITNPLVMTSDGNTKHSMYAPVRLNYLLTLNWRA